MPLYGIAWKRAFPLGDQKLGLVSEVDEEVGDVVGDVVELCRLVAGLDSPAAVLGQRTEPPSPHSPRDQLRESRLVTLAN
eukprot:COSAG05_NODE_6237_length_994_cov_1.139665_1_plen_80_part_00